ncbi:nuclear transport factor 2 family protein [Amycolatopsis sp. NPDC054798]
MPTQTDQQSEEIAFDRLYAEVQQFYARHMHLLDSGAAREWAETFTEDALFHLPSRSQPVRGRAALASNVAKAVGEMAAAGEVQRHWHGMVAVTPRADGAVHVRCYALVFSTHRGGTPQLYRTCVCEDELVRVDGQLLVSERRVTRDDLP